MKGNQRGPHIRIYSFFRAFWLTFILLFCGIFVLWGIGTSYSQIRLIGFADHSGAAQAAFSPDSFSLRFLDFSINFPLPPWLAQAAEWAWAPVDPFIKLFAALLRSIPDFLMQLLRWIAG